MVRCLRCWSVTHGGCVGSCVPFSLLITADLQKQGLACFYNNQAQLIAWADVVFLCCLWHVLSICSVIQPAIRSPCVVYSLVTTIPLLRLTFDFVCPAGKVRVNAEWLVTVFPAALKSSTWQSLPHRKALKLLSDLCFPRYPICAGHKTSCPQFVCKSFSSKDFASSVTQEETFPCFDLTAAQLRESPFSQLLEMSKLVQSHLALLYQASFRDWPAKQGGPISTKTSLSFSCSRAWCDTG
ncbi:LOW QUALITY PROTEIN: NADP-dependent oxidoreductase domain-containing protein 1 [Amazona ochrocephala]